MLRWKYCRPFFFTNLLWRISIIAIQINSQIKICFVIISEKYTNSFKLTGVIQLGFVIAENRGWFSCKIAVWWTCVWFSIQDEPKNTQTYFRVVACEWEGAICWMHGQDDTETSFFDMKFAPAKYMMPTVFWSQNRPPFLTQPWPLVLTLSCAFID